MKSSLFLLFSLTFSVYSMQVPQAQEIINAREQAFTLFMTPLRAQSVTPNQFCQFWQNKQTKLKEFSQSIQGSSDTIINALVVYAGIVASGRGCFCIGLCMHAEHDIPPHSMLPEWISMREQDPELKDFLKKHIFSNYTEWLKPRRRGAY